MAITVTSATGLMIAGCMAVPDITALSCWAAADHAVRCTCVPYCYNISISLKKRQHAQICWVVQDMDALLQRLMHHQAVGQEHDSENGALSASQLNQAAQSASSSASPLQATNVSSSSARPCASDGSTLQQPSNPGRLRLLTCSDEDEAEDPAALHMGLSLCSSPSGSSASRGLDLDGLLEVTHLKCTSIR